MRAYIASRFRNKGSVKSLSSALRGLGWFPIQTWPEEHDNCDPRLAAERDLQEIDSCDACVVLTVDCKLVPGGMHFEAGYAYSKGKKIIVVGPQVNIFYKLSTVVHFETVQEFLNWVQK